MGQSMPPTERAGTSVSPSPLSLTRAQARRADELTIAGGTTGMALMENAGRAIVGAIRKRGLDGPYVVVCGKGNNGGDGYVVARLLAIAGEQVDVVACCQVDEIHGDARTAFEALASCNLEVRPLNAQSSAALTTAGCIVDALLGTGSLGPARGAIAVAIDAINRSHRPVVAIDIPSGLDCDSGMPMGPTVRATYTAALVARKRGFDHPASLPFTGVVEVLDIGVRPAVIAQAIADNPG